MIPLAAHAPVTGHVLVTTSVTSSKPNNPSVNTALSRVTDKNTPIREYRINLWSPVVRSLVVLSSRSLLRPGLQIFACPSNAR
jgi:hypothetical protein